MVGFHENDDTCFYKALVYVCCKVNYKTVYLSVLFVLLQDQCNCFTNKFNTIQFNSILKTKN